MAYYLVKAEIDRTRLHELRARLDASEIEAMRPFGRALDESLRAARLAEDGGAIWEEQDYCQPPLAMERKAVLDDYFADIQVEKVIKGEGWQRVEPLVSVWTLLEKA